MKKHLKSEIEQQVAMKRCGYVVRKNKKGRGVYAAVPYRKGEVVERAPVLLMPEKEIGKVLTKYYFAWAPKTAAIAFGMGSMFNHATHPNMEFYFDKDRLNIVYRTTRPVKKGEEFTIHYESKPGTLLDEDVWFKVVE